MFWIVISGFIGALLAVPLHRLLKTKLFGWTAMLLPAAIFISILTNAGAIANGEVILQKFSWVASLGVELSFRLDGLSFLFSLIISGIGAVIVLYAGAYLEGDDDALRFFIAVLMFMASMLGVVLADNLLTLFVFWELTSLTSYLLIGYKYKQSASRDAALQALLVTGTGGLALLGGVILIYVSAGTFEFSELLTNPEVLRQSDLYTWIVLLVFLGAFTKSAQFPFHFWLPNAMAAPTPVSAYLHSATMVKAGVYLIARLHPVLGGPSLWNDTLLIIGGITMLGAAVMAVPQRDLKRLLAYSTVAVLGTLMMMIGVDSPAAAKAMVIYLAAHSLYKGTLFLTSGAVDHETGTRDVGVLGGLRKAMPVTAAIAGAAMLSMTGIIPFIGFIGKETLYDALLSGNLKFIIALIAAIAANGFMGAVALKTGFLPFFDKPKGETPKTPHEAPFQLWVGPAALALTGLVAGILVYPLSSFIAAAAGQVDGSVVESYTKLWHGFNLALLLSVITIGIAVTVYVFRRPIDWIGETVKLAKPFKPSEWYECGLSLLKLTANAQTRLLQSGYLRNYYLYIIFTFLGLGIYTVFTFTDVAIDLSFDLYFYEIVIGGVVAASALLAVLVQSRLAALAALGMAGYGIAVLFLLYGAPDLAMTQFAIETLTVILFVLVIYKLPKYKKVSSALTRFRDAIIAAVAGGFITLIILLITSTDMTSQLKSYFSEKSWKEAFGRNVVNVILVDFRAIDTLGEITVLAVAAIGVYALMKLVKKGEEV